jgi:hypothetical protein
MLERDGNQSVVRCTCCDLRYPQPLRGAALDKRGHCSVCRFHQSGEIHQKAKRHEEHEVMLRTRLETADGWARDVATENAELKQQRHFAYRTRDKAARLLAQIANVHNLRPNGYCICKAKGCRVAKILDDHLARKLITDVDSVQEHLRWRDRLGGLAYDLEQDPDWDGFGWVNAEAQQQRRADDPETG